MSAGVHYLSLTDAAHRLRLPFARTLALVRANGIRGKLVDHRYWIAEHELRRYRLKTSRHVASRSTIRPPDVSQDGGRAA